MFLIVTEWIMSRVVFGSNSIGIALAVLATVLSTCAAVANDAKTIRIVPRAVYGATVSIESGVRVFRPIPATSHMIVNPNRTPLNLTIKDVTKRVHKTVNHFGQGRTEAAGYNSAGGFYIPPRSRAGRHGGKRHGGHSRRRGGAAGGRR
jgi:hypothetical protein